MRKLLIALALVALLIPSAAGAARKDTTLNVVGYSVPTSVYPKLFAAYQATPQGQGVKFTSSFAASEVQSKAVAAGLPADVVNFSLAPDMERLVQAGLVAPTWDKNQYKGIVSRSVVVFILRDGNPKHIRTWDDLVKPGVQVVFPNPFASGGARWDIAAAYGAELREKKTPAQAQAYLKELFQNNVSQDTSARNALNTFLSGKGDVLLDYESDAKLAQSQGKPVFYLIPKATIQIETPLAAVKGNNSDAAQQFVNWLYTPTAQTIWAQNGFRSVVPSVEKEFSGGKHPQFPFPPDLFTINYLGGWDKVNTQFFDPTNGIVAKIEQGLGVSTGG
ncbi:MAG: sulfate ABC transporter substrate-binding protein [Actinobacteria bacterium]|nr:sulfate ABC transporter substrate-binding protein [Actinomycetota bacterium]MBV8479470.1 sulfate ABC transporter substrate-binding protein [Actinomycetota bacterium]